MLDSGWQPPPLYGRDFSDPASVRGMFDDTFTAIGELADMIREQGNNPNYINVPGGGTLAQYLREDRWESGAIRLTTATLASSLKRKGWVLCDGRNGTPNSIDAYFVGASDGSEWENVPEDTLAIAAGSLTGSSAITTGGPSAPHVTVIAADVCGGDQVTSAASANHTHTGTGHTHAFGSSATVSGNYKQVKMIAMMKL